MPGKIRETFAEKHEKAVRRTMYVGFFVLLAMIVASFVIIQSCDLNQMPASYIMNFSVDFVGLCLGAIIYYNCMVEFEPRESGQLYYIALLVICDIQLLVDVIAWAVQGVPELATLNHIDNFLFYFNSILLAVFYWYYVKEVAQIGENYARKVVAFIHCIALLSTIALIFNNRYGFYFSVDENGVYSRAPLNTYLFCLLGPAIIFFTVFLICLFEKIPRRMKRSLISYALLPAFFAVIQNVTFGVSLEYIALMIALFIIYCNVHMAKAFEYRNQQLILMDQKAKILQSQMQPEFLNKGLLAVRALILKDPAAAGNAIDCFSGYLRGSIDMLGEQGVIPIQEELQFILDYVEIEKLRFGDALTFELDAKARDFSIPPFSIQPLVENAIQYGIRGKESGTGTVSLITYEEKGGYVIKVKDDGVGFGYHGKNFEEHRHVDTSTVRHRIEMMCNGLLEIDAKEGEGTTITIWIPKDEITES